MYLWRVLRSLIHQINQIIKDNPNNSYSNNNSSHIHNFLYEFAFYFCVFFISIEESVINKFGFDPVEKGFVQGTTLSLINVESDRNSHVSSSLYTSNSIWICIRDLHEHSASIHHQIAFSDTSTVIHYLSKNYILCNGPVSLHIMTDHYHFNDFPYKK